MCTILGWIGNIDKKDKIFLLNSANKRGRDGFGLETDRYLLRGLTYSQSSIVEQIIECDRLVGNFRATPTTEAETNLNNLQPYNKIVHNGVISNDKSFGDYPVDSMVLPKIFEKFDTLEQFAELTERIKGSYAIAVLRNDKLYLATNYKPIYFKKLESGFIFASMPEMLPEFSVPMKPYSVMKVDIEMNIKTLELKRTQSKKVLVSASSGLDSTTVAYLLKSEGYDVSLVHFRYSCLAEERELDRIKKISKAGGFPLIVLDMPSVMKGSLLQRGFHKNGIEGTEYAFDWVSARNLLMLAMLTSYAEANNYGYIAFGGNLEESGAYPDNEYEFGRKFNELLPYCTQNGIKIELLQPLANYMKHEIVKIGTEIGVPFELTWSCYSNKDKHCGECAPCFMRKTAFERNGLKDKVFE